MAADQQFSTLAERVYDSIRRDIQSGKILPGSRLVRRNLASQLNVSPVPVTEALLRLESDGLVESAPMFGARVVSSSAENALDDLVLREALECQSARECAVNASDTDLKTLAKQAKEVDAVMRAGADPNNIALDEQHGAFHLAIAAASGRAALARELHRVWFRRHMHRAWVNATEHGIPKNWHHDLIAAIASRDPVRAEIQMRYHTRWNTSRHQPKP